MKRFNLDDFKLANAKTEKSKPLLRTESPDRRKADTSKPPTRVQPTIGPVPKLGQQSAAEQSPAEQKPTTASAAQAIPKARKPAAKKAAPKTPVAKPSKTSSKITPKVKPAKAKKNTASSRNSVAAKDAPAGKKVQAGEQPISKPAQVSAPNPRAAEKNTACRVDTSAPKQAATPRPATKSASRVTPQTAEPTPSVQQQSAAVEQPQRRPQTAAHARPQQAESRAEPPRPQSRPDSASHIPPARPNSAANPGTTTHSFAETQREAALNMRDAVRSASDSLDARQSVSSAMPAQAAGLKVAAVWNPHSNKVEALRKVVSRLLLVKKGQKLEPFAVCSVASGDGKSYVASNLAVLFAQSGKRTLLIDADFRHASQHQLFNVDAGPGLAELLLGESDWDAVRPVEEVPGLFLLPFGRHNGDPLKLMASSVFAEVFAKLADICDVVLVDTPAGGQYVDAQAIAAQVGSAILVVNSNTTLISAAREVSDALTRAGVKMLGAVVNNA